MKGLVIVFPGVDYTVDKPLLYYAAEYFRQQSFEVVSIDYNIEDTDWLMSVDISVKGKEHAEILMLLANTVGEVENQLKGYHFEDYDKVIMVGKGSGAVVGSVFMNKHKIDAGCVLITPIELCFQFLSCKDAMVFVGEKDQLADSSKVVAECRARNFRYYVFKQANHSLETGSLNTDIKYLDNYVQTLQDFHTSSVGSVYEFEVDNLDHVKISLSRFFGKVSLIINTATGCGYTPQYEVLEQLFNDYKEHGFTILDFPCNQFNNQASGTDEEIHNFCSSRYHISFPQFAKINVNGENAIPLYKYLKSECGFHGFDESSPDSVYLNRKVAENDADYMNNSEIKWNFTKFLVDQEGKVLKRYEVTESFEFIRSDIEQLLGISG